VPIGVGTSEASLDIYGRGKEEKKKTNRIKIPVLHKSLSTLGLHSINYGMKY